MYQDHNGITLGTVPTSTLRKSSPCITPHDSPLGLRGLRFGVCAFEGVLPTLTLRLRSCASGCTEKARSLNKCLEQASSKRFFLNGFTKGCCKGYSRGLNNHSRGFQSRLGLSGSAENLKCCLLQRGSPKSKP